MLFIYYIRYLFIYYLYSVLFKIFIKQFFIYLFYYYIRYLFIICILYYLFLYFLRSRSASPPGPRDLATLAVLRTTRTLPAHRSRHCSLCGALSPDRGAISGPLGCPPSPLRGMHAALYWWDGKTWMSGETVAMYFSQRVCWKALHLCMMKYIIHLCISLAPLIRAWFNRI